jgi:hypothetical protein
MTKDISANIAFTRSVPVAKASDPRQDSTIMTWGGPFLPRTYL